MDTPSFKEEHISQIPALQLLQNMGYLYLNEEEALHKRGNKTSNVLLEDVLRERLKIINAEKRISSTRTTYLSDANIENGIQALKDLPLQEGYIASCEAAYNLLTLGKALEQTVDGDKKSFTLQYIDWLTPENNVFHVTEEYSVMRSGSREHYRPDIVLFVNGIPFCIIECKKPDAKNPVSLAIKQHLRNQEEDGIRSLYVYAQCLLSIATDFAAYGSNKTPEEFWAHWEEKFAGKEEESRYNEALRQLKNKALSQEAKAKLFSDRYRYVRQYFDAKEKEAVMPTVQDQYLYGLCSPKRLLDFAFNFVLFDDGEKKIARYQQFFAVKKAMNRLLKVEEGKRKGGYIWHTQGSGKSLTMVMLAQAIAMEKSIRNPKIILVTDRTDLDEQITGTFRKCGRFVENASTGQRLIELLESKSDAIITTIINKFETAVERMSAALSSPDIFVLVDEGHRTQHGTFNLGMEKTLPNACFIAFTGTPLFKKDKNTSKKFGGEIDRYTVDKAVKDKAVVPLLYEGRHAYQEVNDKPLDTYFDLVSEPLNKYQKADLKKKFSRADQLNVAEQKIYAICWDISLHFRDNFKDKTPFKGQLVTQSKLAAIKYKRELEKIGIVSADIVMSAPDNQEGTDETSDEANKLINGFWKKMMDEHGTPKKYEKNIISRFKNQEDPEIIIVVDKLLTGFDVPRNTVLYLTRKLEGHTLLQAIARVNRIFPDKDYGYIIDYYGVLKSLDDALELYSSFDEFDEEDLQGTMINIEEELKKLPQKHAELWDIFKAIKNKKDAEAFQQLLRDEAKRVGFYDKLSAFARILKLALSSIAFHKKTEQEVINKYKDDLTFFMKLKAAVTQRYSDTIDYKKYEGQIQKLIDTHIQTDEVKVITNLVNIFDKDNLKKELEQFEGSAAKADLIASRTAKHISEKMEEDPAFYSKFSEMLKEVIRAYTQQRIDESQYLSKVQDIMNKVLSRTDSNVPEILRDKEVARAFYGISLEALEGKLNKEETTEVATQIALASDKIILDLKIVDWSNKVDIPKKMLHLIGDYLIDEVRDKYQLSISFEEIDSIAEKIVNVAKVRYK